jgi:hypothetical protein
VNVAQAESVASQYGCRVTRGRDFVRVSKPVGDEWGHHVQIEWRFNDLEATAHRDELEAISILQCLRRLLEEAKNPAMMAQLRDAAFLRSVGIRVELVPA